MGVKIALRRSEGGDAQASCNDQDVQPVAHSVASTTRVPEKSPTSRRNRGEKSVLDDIMGDPDDFQDFGDLDAGSDNEGGRWEETCKIRNFEEDMFLAEGLSLERTDFKEAMKDSSSDTLKENASIVDSSLTECKHDIEYCEGPGSLSYKENEQLYPVMEEEQGIHSFSGVENFSAMRNGKLHGTRYFIIKSLSHQNIQLSVEKGVWATQTMNEPILEEAFHNSNKVILIFSVNMSGFFQGYAQMMSPVGWRRDNIWNESSGRNNPWGRTFKIKWLRLHNLPFQKTLHLKNPLNDYKPVKISRDCQELAADVGEALCELFDVKFDLDGKQKRTSVFREDFLLKKPCREFSASLPDEDYVAALPLSQIALPAAPSIPYSSLLYQHAVAESHRPPIKHGRSSTDFAQDAAPANLEAHRSFWIKHPSIPGKPINRQGNMDAFSQLIGEDVPGGRNTVSESISEEDILDMSYEEYLQAHTRNNESSAHLAAGPAWSMQGLPTSTNQDVDDDDPYSKYLADWHRSQKRTVNGYYHPSF